MRVFTEGLDERKVKKRPSSDTYEGRQTKISDFSMFVRGVPELEKTMLLCKQKYRGTRVSIRLGPLSKEGYLILLVIIQSVSKCIILCFSLEDYDVYVSSL